jgi:hypothetical protein
MDLGNVTTCPYTAALHRITDDDIEMRYDVLIALTRCRS